MASNSKDRKVSFRDTEIVRSTMNASKVVKNKPTTTSKDRRLLDSNKSQERKKIKLEVDLNSLANKHNSIEDEEELAFGKNRPSL